MYEVSTSLYIPNEVKQRDVVRMKSMPRRFLVPYFVKSRIVIFLF